MKKKDEAFKVQIMSSPEDVAEILEEIKRVFEEQLGANYEQEYGVQIITDADKVAEILKEGEPDITVTIDHPSSGHRPGELVPAKDEIQI